MPTYPRWIKKEPRYRLRMVAPNLYVGAVDAPLSTKWVGVVDLFGSTRTTDVPQAQLLSLPFSDGDAFPRGALDRIERFLHYHRHYGPVLIHCAAGLSRSASAAIAMLMLQDGLPVEEAARRVREGTGHTQFPLATTIESSLQWATKRLRDASS